MLRIKEIFIEYKKGFCLFFCRLQRDPSVIHYGTGIIPSDAKAHLALPMHTDYDLKKRLRRLHGHVVKLIFAQLAYIYENPFYTFTAIYVTTGSTQMQAAMLMSLYGLVLLLKWLIPIYM